MPKVLNGLDGLRSDAGHSDVSAAGSARTPSTSSAAAEPPSLRQRLAKDWQGYRTAIHHTDSRDRQAESRNNRRAGGGRLKHRWSAVKLASPANYTTEDQAQARAQTAVDKLRALSPEPQEALLRQRERQSSVGPQDTVQREQIPPRSPNPAPATLAALGNTGSALRNILHMHDPSRYYTPASLSVHPQTPHHQAQWSFDALFNSYPGNDSDDGTVQTPVSGSDNGECLKQRMLEDSDDDDMPSHPGISTPVRSEPWSGSNDEVKEIGTFSESPIPIRYTPTSESDGQILQQVDDILGEDTSFLHTILESTVEEKQAIEFLSPPLKSRSSRSDTHKESLESSMRFLGLSDYSSVDMRTLQDHLKNALASPSKSEGIGATNAFATIVKHQAGIKSWELCLRWNDALDEQLQQLARTLSNSVSGLRNFSDLASQVAHDMGTSRSDCIRRWEYLQSMEASPPWYSPEADASDAPTYPDGWNTELDYRLIELKTNRHTFSTIAKELRKEAHACKQRFKQIKPKYWQAKSKKQVKREKAAALKKKQAETKAAAAAAAVSEDIAHNTGDTTGDSWAMPPVKVESNFDDHSDNNSAWNNADAWGTVNNNSKVRPCGCKVGTSCWCGIADPEETTPSHDKTKTEQDMDLSEAYALFKIAMSERGDVDLPVLQSTMLIASPSHTARLEKAFGLICHDQTHNYGQACCENCGFPKCVCACWEGPVITNKGKQEDQRWGDNNILRCWGCGSVEGWYTCTSPPPTDANGWAAPPRPDFASWSSSSKKGDSESRPAPYTPPTVTYWATIESDGERIHVPIDSKDVSGPVKSIANGGMQKICKWVHELGLDDKVGLQDAFELAQSMHQEGDVEQVKNEKAHRKVESRAESELSCRTLGTDFGRGYW